jgi:hypothetical protein
MLPPASLFEDFRFLGGRGVAALAGGTKFSPRLIRTGEVGGGGFQQQREEWRSEPDEAVLHRKLGVRFDEAGRRFGVNGGDVVVESGGPDVSIGIRV